MTASALYFGQVMHRRREPRAYAFQHRVFSLLLDVDELGELDRRLRFFSHNRFNLVSFHDRDFGRADGSDLREWAESLLRGEGIPADGGAIRILCFPRVLGYGFSPLSVWYCHYRDGRVQAVILEVRNTFGEKHQYLLPVDADGRLAPGDYWQADKAFHVSPFITRDARYRFRLNRPGHRFLVRVEDFWPPEEASEAASSGLLASWSGQRRPLDDRQLLLMSLRVPLLGLKVMSLIHWHALRLWLAGVPWFRKPQAPAREVSPSCRHRNKTGR